MDSETSTDIRANLERVQAVVAAACRRAGRSPDDVLVVAVSKTVPAERVKAAVEAGAAALGENRVQEAKDKIEALGHPVPWHLSGSADYQAHDAVGSSTAGVVILSTGQKSTDVRAPAGGRSSVNSRRGVTEGGGAARRGGLLKRHRRPRSRSSAG
jgi:hypothetical protein